MIRRRAGILFAVLSGATVPMAAQSPVGLLVSAQSRTAFSIQGAGARAAGLGGAFAAVADDAAAVTYNPAGLAQFEKPEVSFVGRGLMRNVDFQDVTSATGTRKVLVNDNLDTELRFDPLLVSAAVPLRVGGRILALQLSVQRQIPLAENDQRALAQVPTTGVDSGSPIPYTRLTQTIQQRGQMDVYALALGYELSQRLLAGITVNQWRGAWDLQTASSKYVPPAPPTPPVVFGGKSYDFAYAQSNHLDGQNFNLGLLWRWDPWRVGLVYRSAFHGDYRFTSATATTLGKGMTRTDAVETGLHWPATSSLGIAYRPAETWLLSLELDHTDWSSARFMTGSQGLDGRNFFDLERRHVTRSASSFHAGVEHLFVTEGATVIPVRIGFSREPQPVVDIWTGEQRVMLAFSAGTGIKWGRYTLDAAATYAWASRWVSQFMDVDEILAKYRPSAYGTERIREHRLDLSFAVQFERKPVQDFLHKVFVGD